MNVTRVDELTGADIVLGFGVLNASSTTGSMEFGVVSRGVIELRTDTGSVELTVSNSFAVSIAARFTYYPAVACVAVIHLV